MCMVTTGKLLLVPENCYCAYIGKDLEEPTNGAHFSDKHSG